MTDIEKRQWCLEKAIAFAGTDDQTQTDDILTIAERFRLFLDGKGTRMIEVAELASVMDEAKDQRGITAATAKRFREYLTERGLLHP